jgi:hypothetical protein
MTRPDLLDAVDAVLERLAGAAEKKRLSPPFATAGEAVAKNKLLKEQGVHHFHHIRHTESKEPDGVPSSTRSVQRERDDAGNAGELVPLTSFIEDSCGECGENLKTDFVSETCRSPHGSGPVANDGESGESAAAPDLHGDPDQAPGQPTAIQEYRDRIQRWLAAHPPPPCDPNRCAHCGEAIDAWGTGTLAVLRALTPPDPLWLHVECHHPWYRARLAQVRAALTDPEPSS